jgi:hypothetical protein
MKRNILLAALTVPLVLMAVSADAQGTKPVKTGVVIRGVTLSMPAGGPGTPAGATCDFSNDPVGQHGRLEGSSVNCAPGGTLQGTLFGLPGRFNAYCVVHAPVTGARLIESPIPDDPNHCDLSGITPKSATRQFKGARWR